MRSYRKGTIKIGYLIIYIFFFNECDVRGGFGDVVENAFVFVRYAIYYNILSSYAPVSVNYLYRTSCDQILLI